MSPYTGSSSGFLVLILSVLFGGLLIWRGFFSIEVLESDGAIELGTVASELEYCREGDLHGGDDCAFCLDGFVLGQLQPQISPVLS
ncbi:hypothetical protein CASFOL_011087 [Castilleja foliolosa]|uniref:Uncharacterized protein n=1 Tax=Castilleja foliolosa TaxID=1961234 RepID=A0ABD3DWD1_9LAMI